MLDVGGCLFFRSPTNLANHHHSLSGRVGREQAQGIEQINTAITQMDQVTQSNSASAEESASAAEASRQGNK